MTNMLKNTPQTHGLLSPSAEAVRAPSDVLFTIWSSLLVLLSIVIIPATGGASG